VIHTYHAIPVYLVGILKRRDNVYIEEGIEYDEV
jgi:hypothetical protein